MPGQVVRAVHVPAEIGERSVTVVADQVPGQFGHAGPVVAAHVHGARCRHARQGHHGHLVAEPADLLRIEDAVVQDEPVALAGQREDPAGVVMAQPDRADKQVEVPLLCGHLDAPVDQVGELQARLFVFEDTVGRHSDLGPADHHPDDLLEPGAQCPGRPVRDEAKLGRGPLDPFPGVGQWVAAAVEHAGHRGDGHARGPRHVVDGGRAVLGVAVRRQHARHRSRGTGDARHAPVVPGVSPHGSRDCLVHRRTPSCRARPGPGGDCRGRSLVGR